MPLLFRISLFLLSALLILPVSYDAANAQFSTSYRFLQAVKKGDGSTVTELLDKSGSTLINTREHSTGNRAIHLVIARKNATWVRFILQKGANPNVKNKEGETPLLLATRLRFIEGVNALLKSGAHVDGRNNSRETPLIRAVQIADTAIVRALMEAGADPDIGDSLTGKSARDYAREDPRLHKILLEIEEVDAERQKKGSKESMVGPN